MKDAKITENETAFDCLIGNTILEITFDEDTEIFILERPLRSFE